MRLGQGAGLFQRKALCDKTSKGINQLSRCKCFYRREVPSSFREHSNPSSLLLTNLAKQTHYSTRRPNGSSHTMNHVLAGTSTTTMRLAKPRACLAALLLTSLTACSSEHARAPTFDEIGANLSRYLTTYPGVERGETSSCIELKVDLVRSVMKGQIVATDGFKDRSIDSSLLRNGEVVYFEGRARNVITPVAAGSETLITGELEAAGANYGLIFRGSSPITDRRVKEGSLMRGGASSPMLGPEGAYVCGFGVAVVEGRLNGIVVTDAIEFSRQ